MRTEIIGTSGWLDIMDNVELAVVSQVSAE